MQFLQRVRMTVEANVVIEADDLGEAKGKLLAGDFDYDNLDGMSDWEEIGEWEYDDGSQTHKCE